MYAGGEKCVSISPALRQGWRWRGGGGVPGRQGDVSLRSAFASRSCRLRPRSKSLPPSPGRGRPVARGHSPCGGSGPRPQYIRTRRRVREEKQIPSWTPLQASLPTMAWERRLSDGFLLIVSVEVLALEFSQAVSAYLALPWSSVVMAGD